MFGADRARARVDDTQLRGRQCPHSPRLQSLFPGQGKPEGHHWAALLCSAWQGPGAGVQGKTRVVLLLDERDAFRHKRCSGGFGDGG